MSTEISTSTARETDITSLARRVLEEIFPADDEEAMVAAVSSDFVNHEAPEGTPPGPAGVLLFMHLLARAFSDQRWEIHQTVTEGDRVVLFCTHSGRHTGDFFGLPATGRSFAYRQMHLIRVVGGLGLEHWVVRDDASLMRQLTAA